MDNPLFMEPLFHLGPVPITMPVVVTWAIMAALAALSFAATRRLSLKPGTLQTVLELFVTTVDAQVRETMNRDPAPFRPLIGTIFLFVLVANWSSLIPGVEPPTAHLETDAALERLHDVADNVSDPGFQDIEDPSARLLVEIVQQHVRSLSQAIEQELGVPLGLTAGFNSQDGD